ncbi:PLC-like phosphodiesterase [Zopfia rhizophila CBS 207.26]|uniref:PLC-like phosphodiesterase n=1 Tax=Zopfia rhizophila CBS 207.26 TaxID=1314779 RepID=A0A6A6ECV6_9PEZI|nr:PLC-like phosphodiesterase [Zopfia rhizophila CBS 207.26]
MASRKGELRNWMSKLIDSTPLNAINLVGTHRSQYSSNASILEQLGIGIRFLDMRLNADRSFANAIASVAYFLLSNPSEFVLCQVTHETGPKDVPNSGDKQTFFRALRDHRIREVFYYTNETPCHKIQLKKVRGRAIILAAPDMQLSYALSSPLTVDPATFWPVNFTTKISKLKFQRSNQCYIFDNIDNPWDRINSTLQLALTRSNISQGMISNMFPQEIFFQTWTYAADANEGSEDVARYFAGSIKQVLAHGSEDGGRAKRGLKMQLGLVVLDTVCLDGVVVKGICMANPALVE